MTALRSIADLTEAGLVPMPDVEQLDLVASRYAVSITPYLADLIDRADPADPIARQFVPQTAELATHGAEREDPIGDAPYSPVKGIVHRYADRVLLKIVQACPVYCRFCFRREMVGPGSEAFLSADELETALAYIASRPEIWEVILTGGDPLILSPRRLGEIKARLDAIPHVQVVRFHTRVPVVDPARVTEQMVTALRGRTPTYILLHANHAREFTDAARQAIALLVDGGIPLLGQSVLLKGVNDTVEALRDLLRTMVANRVKPHYLHHPDLAPGTGHFRLPIAKGRALLRELRGPISGLAQPTYMLDLPGGHGKVPIGPDYLAEADGGWQVRDPKGHLHAYSEALPDQDA
ncbi:lysine-2,3-aminomutase-like protein [Lacibacterium aquatile]|uniref:Lysine-2,3-aminomutase-like protein n=1 Tax=Lacibacterium aquatile TaxID=1168082 RepID=A0ABW5DT85_9PROT